MFGFIAQLNDAFTNSKQTYKVDFKGLRKDIIATAEMLKF